MDQPKLSLYQIISLIFLIGLLFFVYQNFYKERNILIKASEFDSVGMDNVMRAAMLNSNTYNPATSFLDPNINLPSSFSGLSAYNTPTPALSPTFMPSFNFSPSLPSANNFSDYYSQAQALAENPSFAPTSFDSSSFSLASSTRSYDPYMCPMPHPNRQADCTSPNCFWSSRAGLCLQNCNLTNDRVVCIYRRQFDCKYELKINYSCVAHYHDSVDDADYQYTCGPAQDNSPYCPAAYTNKVCTYSSTSYGTCGYAKDQEDSKGACSKFNNKERECKSDSNCEWHSSIEVGCNGPSALCPNGLSRSACEAVTLPSGENGCHKEEIGRENTCSNK